MSPENSTRKVNTILKCQEINDIVLSSYGSVGEGDKCLALFTPFLPICDLFLCPSHWLCLCVCFYLSLHLPYFCRWRQKYIDLFAGIEFLPLHVTALAIQYAATRHRICAIFLMIVIHLSENGKY